MEKSASTLLTTGHIEPSSSVTPKKLKGQGRKMAAKKTKSKPKSKSKKGFGKSSKSKKKSGGIKIMHKISMSELLRKIPKTVLCKKMGKPGKKSKKPKKTAKKKSGKKKK